MRPIFGGNGRGPLETLEETLYFSSPLGIWARIRMIGRGCELEISGTLLTVDLRIMDMSEFNVILGIEWLTVTRLLSIVSVGELPPTRRTVLVLYFRGASTIFCPDSIRVQVLGTVSGLASEHYLRGRGETDLDLPRVVCECVDVFQMSYLDYLRIGM